MGLVLAFWAISGVLVASVALFFSIYLLNFWKARGGRRRPKVDGRFPRERLKLLGAVAGPLGAEVVADPLAYRFPFLKTRPPDRPAALLLWPADLETRDPGAPYVVRYEAPVSGGRYLEAWPLGSLFPPTRVNMATPDVKTGDAGFDGRYLVRTDDAAFARAFLSDEARQAIAEATGLGAGGRVRVEVDGLRLRLQKEEQLATAGELEALARVGRRLLDRVRGAVEDLGAVQFYDSPTVPAEASCPICGTALKTGRVECRRCRTPHHRECWDYNGRCAMFACGEPRHD